MLECILALEVEALFSFIIGGGFLCGLIIPLVLLLVYVGQMMAYWIDDCDNYRIIKGNWLVDKVMLRMGWKLEERVYRFYKYGRGPDCATGRSDGIKFFVVPSIFFALTPALTVISLYNPLIPVIGTSIFVALFVLRYSRRVQKRFIKHMEDRTIHKRRDSE